MAVEQLYYADYLGVINPCQKNLAITFLQANGLDRTLSRLCYLVKDQVHPGLIAGLDSVIETTFGADQFVRTFRSHKELPERHARLWERFQGATAEILCEVHVLMNTNEQLTLISNQALYEALVRNSKQPFVTVLNHPDTDILVRGRYYSMPDCSAVGIHPAGRSATLLRTYEFKSASNPENGTLQQESHIKSMFGVPECRRVFRETIGTITGINPKYVEIPRPANLELTKVVAETDTHMSIRRFAFFLLKVATGQIQEDDCQRYFLPIDASTARLIEELRARKTVPYHKKHYRV